MQKDNNIRWLVPYDITQNNIVIFVDFCLGITCNILNWILNMIQCSNIIICELKNVCIYFFVTKQVVVVIA